jgi:hypothetical protein
MNHVPSDWITLAAEHLYRGAPEVAKEKLAHGPVLEPDSASANYFHGLCSLVQGDLTEAGFHLGLAYLVREDEPLFGLIYSIVLLALGFEDRAALVRANVLANSSMPGFEQRYLDLAEASASNGQIALCASGTRASYAQVSLPTE